MTARLTFAIPFHRHVGYLREALESVQQQTSALWTALVCDDGDEGAGAAALVAELDDSRIVYLRRSESNGMVANWNACLDRAETDLVTLLHADDRLHPHYTEELLDTLDAYPSAVAGFCRADVLDERGRRRFSFVDAAKRWFEPGTGGRLELRGEGGLRALARGNFIMCPTLCYRKSRLGTRRFDPSWRQVQDLELTSRLLLDGELLVGSPVRAYAYRRHRQSATEQQSQSLLRFREEFALLDQIAARAREHGWQRAADTASRKSSVRLHLLYRALLDFLGGNRARARQQLGWARSGRADDV
ncbi:MAG: glycosyltransferase [Proteobacteria bacterium]|nr:glycosyltransferase [Pseudomonadota bacterium]